MEHRSTHRSLFFVSNTVVITHLSGVQLFISTRWSVRWDALMPSNSLLILSAYSSGLSFCRLVGISVAACPIYSSPSSTDTLLLYRLPMSKRRVKLRNALCVPQDYAMLSQFSFPITPHRLSTKKVSEGFRSGDSESKQSDKDLLPVETCAIRTAA